VSDDLSSVVPYSRPLEDVGSLSSPARKADQNWRAIWIY